MPRSFSPRRASPRQSAGRIVPLAAVALVVLAACTTGDSDAVDTRELISVDDTDAAFDDVCSTEHVLATSDPDVSEPDASLPAGSEPFDSEPFDSEPWDSEPWGSAPLDSEPVDSEPLDSEPLDSEPVDADGEVPDIDLPDEIPDELEVTVLEDGEGPRAAAGDVVIVHYTGVLSEDGEEFDSSHRRGQPFALELGPNAGVIEGWSEGLIGAREGDRLQLDIPSDLAYGEQGSGDRIPPDAALTFVIDVVAIVALEYPSEWPTELGKTMLAEGDADGDAAQWFDRVTFDLVIGVPDIAYDDPPPPVETEPDSSLPDGSIPEGSLPDGSLPDDSEPAASEPAETEPTETEPAETEPAETEPAETEPAETEPAETDPESSDPVSSDPDSSDPDDGVAEPGDGTVVFNSFVTDPMSGQPAQPLEFELQRGMSGLDGLEEGLIDARAGDRFQLDLPPDLAFGEFGAGDLGVPPNAPVVMYVSVISVDALPSIDVPDEAPTDLEVTVLDDGSGYAAGEGDTVVYNYIAVAGETGERVGSNWGGQPRRFVIGAGTEIPGFDDGLIGARAGDQIQLDVPADLAYGDEGAPDYGLDEGEWTLSFLVDVVAVVPATTAGDAPTDLELPLSTEPLYTEPDLDPDSTESVPFPEIVTTDLIEGSGAEATFTATAIVNIYAVCAANGHVLYNTWDDDQRQFIAVSSGGVLTGLAQGISEMQVGGVRIIQVPTQLAYDREGNEDLGIGPDQDLIFVVELYGVIPGADPFGF